jgi:hypothetical protein
MNMHVAIVEILIQKEAYLESRDILENTPLHLSAQGPIL